MHSSFNLLIIKAILLIFIMLACIIANASPKKINYPIKIGIIDTGLDSSFDNLPICKEKGWDFTTNSATVGEDAYEGKHGSNIAYTIYNAAGRSSNVCFLIYKVYKDKLNAIYMPYEVAALYKAIEQKATILNLSFEGTGYVDREYDALKFASDSGITIFTSAGNHYKNLDDNCNVYPACYNTKLYIITDNDNQSNKYKKAIVIKNHHCSLYVKMNCGTSQSTAYAVGLFTKALIARNK